MAWKLPANKRDVYTIVAETGEIPSGTWKVGAPLPTFIKPGGFTHTNTTTLKYCGGFRGAALAFGQNTTSGASVNASIINWGSAIACNAIADRNSATITKDASGDHSAGFYALVDGTVYVGTETGAVKGELIHATGGSSTATVTLDRVPSRYVGAGSGMGSTYDANAKLIPIDAYASSDVSLSNLTIDGNGTYPARLAVFWFVDNLSLTDCTFLSFLNDGTYTVFCRNIQRLRCHVDESNANTGGQGRCHTDNRVYNTESLNCTYGGSGTSASGPRHAHTTEYGVSNKRMQGGRADDTFDEANTPFWEGFAHVGPDIDCEMIDCRHNEGAIGGGIGGGGHQLFGYGSTNPVITNCDANGRDFIVALDTTGGVYTNVTGIGRIILIGCSDRTAGTPNPGAFPNHAAGPTDLLFDTCEFEDVFTNAGFPNNAGAAEDYGAHFLDGTIEFRNCTQLQAGDAQCGDIRSDNDFTLKFNGGSYRNTGGTVYRMFDLGNGTSGVISLVLAGNLTFTHLSGGGVREAFRLFGTGSVTNNATSISWNLAGSVDFMLEVTPDAWTGEIADPS